ncbi:hypothetical protein E3A20_28410, partial [Planctomyces bekefii]
EDDKNKVIKVKGGKNVRRIALGN